MSVSGGTHITSRARCNRKLTHNAHPHPHCPSHEHDTTDPQVHPAAGGAECVVAGGAGGIRAEPPLDAAAPHAPAAPSHGLGHRGLACGGGGCRRRGPPALAVRLLPCPCVRVCLCVVPLSFPMTHSPSLLPPPTSSQKFRAAVPPNAADRVRRAALPGVQPAHPHRLRPQKPHRPGPSIRRPLMCVLLPE